MDLEQYILLAAQRRVAPSELKEVKGGPNEQSSKSSHILLHPQDAWLIAVPFRSDWQVCVTCCVYLLSRRILV